MDSEENEDDPEPMPTTGDRPTSKDSKKNIIWNYFVRVDEGREKNARCNMCLVILKTPTGTTSTLVRHLKNKHPKQHEKYLKEDEAKKQKQSPKNLQPQISTFFKQDLAMGPNNPRAKKITNLLGRVLCSTYSPYTFVDDPCVKDLVNFLEPGYKIPSRKVFSRTVIPNLYSEATEDVTTTIASHIPTMLSLSLTTDLWTSRAGDSYIALTCHILTSQFEMKKFTLSNSPFPGTHSAVHILEKLKELIKAWNIPDDATIPIYVVSDNARNMVAAVESSKWIHIPCFAHSLQLSIKDAKDQVDGMAAVCRKVRSIVGYYKRSTKASERLEILQKQLNKPVHKLIQDVETRWNSEFMMLDRLIEQQEVVLADLTHEGKMDTLTVAEWQLAKGYVKFLRPIYDATLEICTDSSPTISLVIPILDCVNSIITRYIVDGQRDYGCHGITFGRQLIKALRARFPNPKGEKTWLNSMVLDPRFRTLLLTKNETDLICQDFIAEVKMLQSSSTSTALPTAQATGLVAETSTSFSLWENFDTLVQAKELELTSQQSEVETVIKQEIDMYLMEKVIPRTSNPLQWWMENQGRYPRLNMLAKKYLSIPATEVGSERLFSTAGNIVTHRRELLAPDNVEKLTFMHDYIVNSRPRPK